MSLLTSALGLVAQQGGFGGIFGGNGGPNLAKSFSRRLGLPCVVRDDQKDWVMSMRARGATPQEMCAAAMGTEPVFTVEDVIKKHLPPVPPGGIEAIVKEEVIPGIVGAITGGTMSAVTTGGQLATRFVGGAMRRAPGVYRTTTGKLSSVVLNSGKSMSVRDIASFIRFVGDIALAASILGISMQDAADAVTRKRRRRRGISAANLATAKRVICQVNRMAKDLNCKPTTRRRTSCR